MIFSDSKGWLTLQSKVRSGGNFNSFKFLLLFSPSMCLDNLKIGLGGWVATFLGESCSFGLQHVLLVFWHLKSIVISHLSLEGMTLVPSESVPGQCLSLKIHSTMKAIRKSHHFSNCKSVFFKCSRISNSTMLSRIWLKF